MQIASQETPGDVKEKLAGRQREANEYNENAVKKYSRIDCAVGVCKKLVSHFSHSWKARDAL
ncbi:hypothetical protein FQN60_012618 [Etheostoma spectabile]|uniref:Uncharacterized protein n=1 Tax=Etheostoma spectabile TaxID=54343 RepID=A0A5J5D894_9PERO|nr:hypothetical protein FQN60_012618 [Etheostoma spectabile]